MASTLASGNWQRVWVCLWTKDWALPVCFPTISIWWSAEMMAMWAAALANGNSMHLLSDVEKGTRSVPASAVSSTADKLSSGIKGLTFSLAAYWLVLKSLTPLSNGPRLILKCLSLLREVLGPVFKDLMLLAPEAASLVISSCPSCVNFDTGGIHNAADIPGIAEYLSIIILLLTFFFFIWSPSLSTVSLLFMPGEWWERITLV